MNYKREVLRALGLSILAALGLMAFMASGAQAGGGEWLILSQIGLKTVKELPFQLENITGEQEPADGKGNLFRILGLNVLLKCKKLTVENALIVPTGHAKGKLTFAGCYFTDLSLKENTTCIVDTFSTNVLSLLILHATPLFDGKVYVLFSPLTGLTFVTPVFLDAGPEECSITAAAITGHVVASISLDSKVHATEPLLSTKGLPLTLFIGDKLLFGTQVGHLEVDARLRLDGVEKGRAWGYHAL